MLTIENYTKLKYKVVGKMGWYVDSVTEQMLYDPMTFKTTNEKYIITLTNRTYSETVVLHRNPEGTVPMGYKLQHNNNILYIDNNDIRDMDKFLYWLDRILSR